MWQIFWGAFATSDLILHNGNIYTLDDSRPLVSAIAIQGDRILAIGNDEEVLASRQSHTRVVDLRGKTVIPGLVDAHAHLRNLGRLQEQALLFDARSFDEVVERVRARADGLPHGEWIVGRGWNQERWSDKSMPAHDLLSEVVPNHPVSLVRVDAHAALANSAAMRLAGITSGTQNPVGGVIVKEDNQPTGLFLDNAIQLITDHIPSPDLEKTREWYIKAQEICLTHGLTEVQEAGVSEMQLEALLSLEREGKLKLRVYAMLERGFFNSREHKPFQQGRVICRSVKVILDGALGSRGAALLAPYSDAPDQKGFLLLTEEELRQTVDRAFRSGFQVNVHAIGDYANRLFLNTLEAALKDNPVSDHRSRSEHAQIVAPDDIPRFAQLGVIASIQPTHCTSDMNMAEARLGTERIRGAYAWRKFMNSGVRLCSGSDFPVESPNPFWGIYAAVTRKDHQSHPPNGWHPEEVLTMDEAMKSFTVGPAYASFQEHDKGILTPGKLADFVVLDRDITKAHPSELLQTELMATVIGGELIFGLLEE